MKKLCKYSREGRTIYRNGQRFIYISKEEGATPVEADNLALKFFKMLNGKNCKPRPYPGQR